MPFRSVCAGLKISQIRRLTQTPLNHVRVLLGKLSLMNVFSGYFQLHKTPTVSIRGFPPLQIEVDSAVTTLGLVASVLEL